MLFQPATALYKRHFFLLTYDPEFQFAVHVALDLLLKCLRLLIHPQDINVLSHPRLILLNPLLTFEHEINLV